jgi:hypothetical protein
MFGGAVRALLKTAVAGRPSGGAATLFPVR